MLVCLGLVGVIAVGQALLAPRPEPLTTACVHPHSRPNRPSKFNAPAFLEYGRRFRTGFGFQVRAMCGQNADLIKKFKQGDYKDNRDEFEADTDAFCNSLTESIEQFDAQEVPSELFKSHAKISNCHRLCYDSVQALRQAYEAQGAEQARLVKVAEQKMKQAWVTGDAGVKLHNQIWARMTI